MAGIIFLGTRNIEKIKDFYISKIGMKLWLEQADCVILRHENLLLGFCAREEIDKSGIITFFYKDQGDVEGMYRRLHNVALEKPKVNSKYQIYNFFARDPEDRMIEFQHFLNRIDFSFQ